MRNIVIVFLSFLSFLSCTKDEPAKSSEAKILTYSINGVNFTIDHNKKQINGTLPFSTDKTKLIAKFSISTNATIKVGNKTQVSGSTENDFSSEITYTVTSESGNVTNDYKVNIKKNSEAKILTYSINGISFNIDDDKKEISGTLPSGADRTKLVAKFTISAAATIKIGDKVQVSEKTVNDFSSTLTYTVKAEDGKVTNNYKVKIIKNTKAEILTYSINGVNFIIDHNKKEITGTLPFATDKTKLIAKFTISDNATIKIGNKVQVSGTTANDFSSPITYTITSEDGKNKVNYTVNAKFEKNNQANILAFTINNIIFKINQVTKKITGTLPYGTDRTKLKPKFTLSNNATVKVNNKTQTSGATTNDFRIPITYTVISENGKTKQDYIVTVVVAKNDKAIITSFSIDGSNFKIDQKSKEITGNIYGLDITKLKPKFTVSAGATVRVAGRLQQSEVSVNNFSKNVIYEVTSQDTKVKNNYTIKVTQHSSDVIISKFEILQKDNTGNLYADIQGNIDNNKSEITLNIDGTGSNYFVATFVTAKGAEVKANNMLQVSGKTSVDFTNTVNYSVKSADGTNTKVYKVKINYRETFKYNLNTKLAIGMPIDVMPEKVFGGVNGVVFTDVTTPKMPGVSVLSSNGRVTGTVSVRLCAHTYGILAKKSSRKLKCYFKVTVWNLVGSGTSADPYLIFTPKHLDDVRYYKKSHFKLMNDIDLSTSKYKDNFRPIGQNDGSYGDTFFGVLDGNGKKISKLKIKSNVDGVGLFRFISSMSVIKNLGIEDANVESNTEGVGVIAGHLVVRYKIAMSKTLK